MIDYCRIGGRIADLRKERHITQEQLAEILNISVKHCSEVERGLSSLSLEKLECASELFDCNMDFLIHGATPQDCSRLFPASMIQIMSSDDEQEKKLLTEYLHMYEKLRNSEK